jgi:hypothetical protein
MARAKVLTQRAAARGLGVSRYEVLNMLRDGRLTRADLNGKEAVKDDAKYRALVADKAPPTLAGAA